MAQLGVAALVARFWSLHYRYDDVLILVSMIALLRLTAGTPSVAGARTAARALLLLTAATMLALVWLAGARRGTEERRRHLTRVRLGHIVQAP